MGKQISFREKLDDIRYRTGYVLRNVDGADFVVAPSKYKGISINSVQKNVNNAVIYVPDKCVCVVHPDVQNQAWVAYDVVLMDEFYNVYYKIDGDVREHVKSVSRDLIIKWYYLSRISESVYYYDMMRVPRNTLGLLNVGDMWQQVSWKSSIIRPGVMVTLTVNKSDIRYVPKIEWLNDVSVIETNELEDYVNINLPEEAYMVDYKDAKTHWKMKHVDILRPIIMDDYLTSVQARVNNMAAEKWLIHKRELLRVVLE